jgi:hypothetical protein
MIHAASQLAQAGENRTVRATTDYVDRMVEGTREFPATSGGGLQDLADVRVSYAEVADPIGHVPQAGLEQSTAERVLFVDKLGERLAFERTGVRLYDGVLSKHMAYGTFHGGPEFEELVEFREEELAHVRLLTDAIRQVGGDPAALTPSAALAATASRGVGDVIADPRTSLLQSLEALLVAELSDNDCWTALASIAETAGEGELAARFLDAIDTEENHLVHVRRWIAAGQGRPAPDDELDGELEDED